MDVTLKTPLCSHSQALRGPHDHKQGDSVFYQPLGIEGLNLLNLKNWHGASTNIGCVFCIRMLFIYLLLIDVFFNHVSLISSCLCGFFFYELILYLFLCCKIGSLIRLLTISSNSHSHISYVFVHLHLARVQRYTDEHLCQGQNK